MALELIEGTPRGYLYAAWHVRCVVDGCDAGWSATAESFRPSDVAFRLRRLGWAMRMGGWFCPRHLAERGLVGKERRAQRT